MKRRRRHAARLERILTQIQTHEGDRRVALGLLGHAAALRRREVVAERV